MCKKLRPLLTELCLLFIYLLVAVEEQQLIKASENSRSSLTKMFTFSINM